VALADPDPDRLSRAAILAPGAHCYGDGFELLNDKSLQAVIVAAPSHLHARYTVAAFERGLHVYVEKPLASALPEGGRVVDAWRAAGTVGVTGFNCRFTPLYRRLLGLLRDDEAGTPICVRTVFTAAAQPLAPWKRSRESGGGVLLDLASHHIDLLRFLFSSDVDRVHATISSLHSEADTALVELVMASGVSAQLFFSFAAVDEDRVEIYGDRARLSVSRFTSLDVDIKTMGSGTGARLRAFSRRLSSIRQVPLAVARRGAPMGDPGYAAILQSFVAAAHGAALPPEAPTVLDGFRCLQVVAAAEESASTGRVTPVNHSPPETAHRGPALSHAESSGATAAV
jgi:myo-inositol 2-dehydrogenase / D-chiro-inositol 1-dehydrogenase